jgi:hypothetical protein
MPAGHDRRSGRRAGRRDEKPGEAGALVIERVEIRRLQPGMPVPTDRAVSLIICHHEDDIRFSSFQLGKCGTGERQEQRQEKRGKKGFHKSSLAGCLKMASKERRHSSFLKTGENLKTSASVSGIPLPYSKLSESRKMGETRSLPMPGWQIQNKETIEFDLTE